MSGITKLAMILGLCTALGACGQTGKLYLPGGSGEVTTRSTQTPSESGGTADTPQTVDSPPTSSTSPTEVEEDEKQKKTPPSEPQKN